MYYVFFYVITLLVTLVLNLLFKVDSVSTILIIFFASFVIEVIMDALVAYLIHKLPRKWMNPDYKIFRVYKFERKFYEKLGIKKWKSLVPDLGGVCDFKKDKLYDPNNSEYLYKFMEESCYGELIHFVSVILSFIVLLLGIGRSKLLLTICLPISFINALPQLLPALIQRYVRPRINLMYKRRLRIENKNAKGEDLC